MATNYQTLVKLNWNNQQQLIDDLNHNFAIIENSPLYKGIPGKTGDKGDIGERGVRGSRFFFIDLREFANAFPSQSLTTTNLTLDWFNLAIVNALDIEDSLFTIKRLFSLDPVTIDGNFIEGDIVVMVDTSMARYSEASKTFKPTGISFNILSSWEQTFFEKIEETVNKRVEDDERLIKLQNIFKCYPAWAKVWSDSSSNTQPTSTVSTISVYYPELPQGLVKHEGVLMTNENGQIDVRIITFNIDETNYGVQTQTILGDPAIYVDLMNNTLNGVADGHNLSSFYAPGYGRLPALTVLQNDDTSGIMFGNKNGTNFLGYSHIFHTGATNAEIAGDGLVLKSHTSFNELEYSQLVVLSSAMEYIKYVHFGHDLRLDRNLRMPVFIDKTANYDDFGRDANAGLMDTGHIKTGRFTTKFVADPNHPNSLNWFDTTLDTIYRPVWNGTGQQADNVTRSAVFDAVYGVVNADINSVNKGKARFTYKDIILTQYPHPSKDDDLKYKYATSETSRGVGLVLVIDDKADYIEKGQIKKDYFIDDTVLTKAGVTDIIDTGDILTSINLHNGTTKNYYVNNLSRYYSLSDSANRYLGKYAFASADNINILADSINKNLQWFQHYWRKDQWHHSFEIPWLDLNDKLFVSNDVVFGLDDSHAESLYEQFFKNTKSTNSWNLQVGYYGNDANGTERASVLDLQSNTIITPFYKTLVLVTDSTGKILKSYSLETLSPGTRPDPVPSTSIWSYKGMRTQLNADRAAEDASKVLPYSQYKVVTSNYINWVLNLIDTLATYLEENYWRKDQFAPDPAVIPALTVTGALNSMGIYEKLTSDGINFDLIYGRKILTADSNPTNMANSVTIGANTTTIIGYQSLMFPNMARNTDSGYKITDTPTDNLKGVMVTDATGKLINQYTIEVATVNFTADGRIVKDTQFDDGGNVVVAGFPNDSNHVATMNYIYLLLDEIATIEESLIDLIPDVYTKSQFVDGSITAINVGTLDASGDSNLTNVNVNGQLKLDNLLDIGSTYKIVGINKDETNETTFNTLGTLKPSINDGTNDVNTFVMPTRPDDDPTTYELDPTLWDTDQHSIMTGVSQKWIIEVINIIKSKINSGVLVTDYFTDRHSNIPNGAIILWHSGKTRTTDFGEIRLSDGSKVDGYYKFTSYDELGEAIEWNLPRGWYPCCGCPIPENGVAEAQWKRTPDLMQRANPHLYMHHAHGFKIGILDDLQYIAGKNDDVGTNKSRTIISIPLIKHYEENGDVFKGDLTDDHSPPDPPEYTHIDERAWVLNVIGAVPTTLPDASLQSSSNVGLTDSELQKINLRLFCQVNYSVGNLQHVEIWKPYSSSDTKSSAYWYAASTSSDNKKIGINPEYPEIEMFTPNADQVFSVIFVNNTNDTSWSYCCMLSYFGDVDGVKQTQSAKVNVAATINPKLWLKDITVVTDPYGSDPFITSAVYDRLAPNAGGDYRGTTQYWNLYIWKYQAVNVLSAKATQEQFISFEDSSTDALIGV
jgi:hypothetical protein